MRQLMAEARGLAGRGLAGLSCRAARRRCISFYGSRSPGPNSHFYTVDPDECASLKILQSTLPDTQPRWNFESLDFKSRAPRDRSCPNGTVPVYPAYNNGFIRHVDSNHRITTSTVAVAEVVNRGWMSEGVVMCAPR